MGRARWVGAAVTILVGLAACQAADPGDDPVALEHENVLIDLWADGTTAFGIFVPNERPPLTDEQRQSGERPAPLYKIVSGVNRFSGAPLSHLCL